MQANLKWLLLPPALALVMFLGPFGANPREREPAATTPAEPAAGPAAAGPSAERPAPRASFAPSLWPVGSTLLGVVLLGFATLVLARRLGRSDRGAERLITLRQSLNLGPRQRVHVVQFEDRVLLLGESNGHLVVLDNAADVQAAADDRRVAGRGAERDLEEGAVPRDMVLPSRPPVAARKAARAAPARVAPPAAPQVQLAADFKKLLRRAAGVGQA